MFGPRICRRFLVQEKCPQAIWNKSEERTHVQNIKSFITCTKYKSAKHLQNNKFCLCIFVPLVWHCDNDVWVSWMTDFGIFLFDVFRQDETILGKDWQKSKISTNVSWCFNCVFSNSYWWQLLHGISEYNLISAYFIILGI